MIPGVLIERETERGREGERERGGGEKKRHYFKKILVFTLYEDIRYFGRTFARLVCTNFIYVCTYTAAVKLIYSRNARHRH